MDKSQVAREERLLAEGREKMLEAVMKAEASGAVGSLPYQNYLIRQCLEQLAADIKLDAKRKNGAGAYKKFALYLGTIDPKIAALRAIQAVLETLFRAGAADIPQPVYKKAAQAAGKAVYGEYLMRHFKKLNPQIFNSLQREYDKSMTKDERHLLDAFKAKFEKEGYEFPSWDFGDLENVGMYLMGRMVAHGFIESWTKTEHAKGRAHVVQYAALAEHLRSSSLEIMHIVASAPRVAGPMIEAPRDWDAQVNGGGGYHSEEMRRLMPYAMQGTGPKQVAPIVVQSMNMLQRRRWRINKDVFTAVRKASLKHSFGDVVGAEMPTEFPVFPEGCDDGTKKKWKGAARRWYTEKKIRAVKHQKAQRVFQEAQELQQYPVIWFPWFADSRGRKYARALGVSPQGNDLEKGLLQLEQGRPIKTARGLYWFKVYGANRWGEDKADLDDRAAWVDNNEDMIRRIGVNPDVHREWMKADSPVQFLAWCMEYAAYKLSPETHLCRLVMAQDGTCNGLQNLSALMWDEVGGASVNLVPGPHQRDIYGDVAHVTTELLEALPPSKYRDAWLAHVINRKITKRTTMTVPYGCTRFACSQFINDDYLMVEHPPEIDPADYGEAANFLSHVIWSAISKVVVKAREVMEWMKGWAKHAAQNGHVVGWHTPSGKWVVSEYEKMAAVRIKSVAFKTAIRLYKPEAGKPDLVKIANAVAPNFTHSLDSDHLDLVVIAATLEGMEPVTVHDDFGVHPDDTDRFHEIIREQFISLYLETNLLQDMADRTSYPVPPPSRGSLDLKVILKSQYFFA